MPRTTCAVKTRVRTRADLDAAGRTWTSVVHMDVPLGMALQLAARLVLAGVLLAAGAAKRRDRQRFQATLVAFGSPARVAGPLAVAVPIAEILVGAGLFVDSIASWAALAALTLLVVFTAAIAVNLLRGRRPVCPCFGELSSAPIGAGTLLRNAIFVALAIGAALPGRGAALLSVFDLLGSPPLVSPGVAGAAGIALALVAGQLWLIGLLLGREQRLSARVAALEARLVPPVQGLLPGVAAPVFTAPVFTAPDLRGETVTLAALLQAGQPVLLYFFDPECGPCTSLLPQLTRWQAEHGGRLRFVLVGRRIGGRAITPEYKSFTVLAQEDREVSDLFKVPGIPSAQIIAPGGRVQSTLAVGPAAIAQLMASIP